MGRSCWILMTAIHFYVLVHVCFDNEFLLKPVKTKKYAFVMTLKNQNSEPRTKNRQDFIRLLVAVYQKVYIQLP